MDIKFLNESKEEIEFELDNVTIIELLRAYLNNDSNVTFAAWKREHPTKTPIMKVKAKDAKKAVKSAIDSITKDLDKFSGDFAKLK